MSGFPHLFSPLTLRHRTLKSRLVFGAHTANMAEGGLPGERHLGLDLRDGTRQHVAADALVLATVNQPETRLQQALAGDGRELHAIGDCVAPRLAVMAIYEGRELALRL
jgi:hypothetical protein